MSSTIRRVMIKIDGPDVGEVLAFPDKDRIVIGRAIENTVALTDTHVSRHHLALVFDPALDRWHGRDLESRFGTFVGDQPAVVFDLPLGDTPVLIGSTRMTVRVVEVNSADEFNITRGMMAYMNNWP